MDNFIIYKHTNLINGKVYIGQTKQTLGRRARPHGEGYLGCPKFWPAIQKYGWSNFSHEILEENLTQEEANQQEIYWIKYFQSCNEQYGYNCTPGGNNFMAELWKDEEYRKKMSKSFSKARKKIPREQRVAWCEKISNIAKEKNWNNKDWRQSHIENFLIGDKNPNSKAMKNIEIGKVFLTIKEAANWCHLNAVSGIGQCCKRKQKTSGCHPETGKRLHWEYYNKAGDIRDECKQG